MNVLGITSSQIQAGAYALVLNEEEGAYRLPVIVGVAEAQSIAVKLEDVTPPRPLSHDLLVGVSRAFGITLKEVFIYQFENGVFMSELHFSDDDRSVVVDSRTSDAIALALRTGAPIYTTRDILLKAGFVSNKTDLKVKPTVVQDDKPIDLNRFAVEELEKMLARCVEREEYERAAEIKRVIVAKTTSGDEPN